MQSVSSRTVIDSVKVGGLVAYLAQDDLSWGEGSIIPQSAYNSWNDQLELIKAVLANIQPVSDTELAYSSCTDGRIPAKLASGKVVPVREQMVGADMVSAFYVAEVLGDHFYKSPDSPVRERLLEVAHFLKEHDLLPSLHIACEVAAGFLVIMQNALRFAGDDRFRARLKELLPASIFDEDLYRQMQIDTRRRLGNYVYDGLDTQLFLDVVSHVSGARAIAELKEDGRGVHGHVEEQIVRIKMPGYAINEGRVAQMTDGREVFGVNDARIEKIARLFAQGNDNDYKKAYMALEEFADTGHGTLAKDLPTWIVEVV